MTETKTTPKIVASIPVPLSVPITVKDAEGKEARRDGIVLRRPKFAHAKKLAILIGPQFLKGLLADVSIGQGQAAAKPGTEGEPSGQGSAAEALADVDMGALIQEVMNGLLTEKGLDGLTELIASMADESPEFIDELDWVDLMAVATAFMDFFPALRSLTASK